MPAAGYQTESFPQTRAPEAPPYDYQNIQARPEMFGAQVGAEEERLGAIGERGASEIAQAAIQRQLLYNQIVSDKAQTDYTEKSNTLLFGDPRQGTVGLFGMHGEDAMRRSQEIMGAGGELDQLREQIANTMPNARARLEFNEYTRRQRMFQDRDVAAHYEKEMQSYGAETQKVRATTAIQTAGQWYNDPTKIQEAIRTSDDANVKQAQGLWGMNVSDDIKMQYVRAGRDAIAKAVVDGYLSHNDHLGADKFLQSFPIANPQLSEQLHKETHNAGIKSEVVNDIYGTTGGGQPAVDKNTVAQTTMAIAPNLKPEDVWATIGIESSFGANTDNKISPSNTGIFQMAKADAPGGKNDTIQNQLAEGIKRMSADKIKLADMMGRDVTGAEAYLAHQQGVAGATWLLTHPNEPAKNGPSNGASMAVKIKNNGGNPEAPSKQFTDMWTSKFNRFTSGAQVADYSGMIEDLRKKYQNPEDFAQALSALHGQETLKNTFAANAQAEANRVNKAAADKYTQEILKPNADFADIKARIATDPNLNDYQTRAHLTSLTESKLTGALNNEEAKLGPGYFDVQKRIMAEPGDPNRISKLNDVLALARPENGGWLTVAGADKLSGLLDSRKTVQGEEKARQRHAIETAVEEIVNPRVYRDTALGAEGANNMSKWLMAAEPVFKEYEGRWNELGDVLNGPLGSITKQFTPQIDKTLVDKPPLPASFLQRLFGGGTPQAAPAPVPQATPGVAPPISGVQRPAPGSTLHYNANGELVK